MKTTNVESSIGTVITVDEHATLGDVRRAEPKFFSVKFGKRESYSMHRGCLILRMTVEHPGRDSQRKTIVYLFGEWTEGDHKYHGTLHMGEASTVDQAKKMIDKTLETGKMPDTTAFA